MSLANKVFRNNKTGETIRVIDSFENIAILENRQKIDVTKLMDPNQFTEQIDPSSFFNNQDAYNALTEKIKSIPVNNIVDESGDVVSINVDGSNDIYRPAIEESAIIMSSEEDEMAELARKYGATLDNGDAITKQAAAFDKLLNPEKSVDEQPVTQVVVNNQPNMEVNREYTQPPVQRIEVEDPIITMFKRTKRNVNFNVSVEISDKIPRLDFIEMMEDSYEISMIDFLADEFTNKILNDPSQIRETIKSKIKQLVYGMEVRPEENKLEVVSEPNMEEDSEKVKVENNTKKPRAKRTTKNVPEPPKPPASRMTKEGKEPEKPKNMQ